MLQLRFPSIRMLACGLVLAAAAPLFAEDNEAVGVARISKPSQTTVRGQSDGVNLANCQTDGGPVMTGCPNGNCQYADPYRTDWRTADWSGRSFHQKTQAHSLACECWGANHGLCKHGHGLYYHDCSGQDMINYFRCKFGYFCPSGCGGAGCPPFGHYARVYPEDPGYFDQRDGQLWGAQGYGVPIAVPLAPVVGHQWNYSWGTPASRLTPVSRVAPY